MVPRGKPRTWSGGVDLRGPLALGATQREGAARLPNRRGRAPPRAGFPPPGRGAAGATAQSDEATAGEAAPGEEAADLSVEEGPTLGAALPDECSIMERALRLLALLQNATEVRAPQGVPCEGRVASFENALAFVQRRAQLLHDFGAEASRPRVTYHWTAEENFRSIVESNLRVPDPEAGVRKKHGAAFGRGIYTCPDYRMAREDFAYGASATFVCLCLQGRPLVRHHRPGQGLLECRGPDFDSVTGRLPNRYVDTWVFPESDQLLPCFLVDEVAIPAAVAVLREAITVLQEPWEPAAAACWGSRLGASPAEEDGWEEEEQELREEPEEAGGGHHPPPRSVGGGARPAWRAGRRAAQAEHSDAGGPEAGPSSSPEAAGRAAAPPYGGDVQAAARAEDRAAIRQLMAERDQPHQAHSSSSATLEIPGRTCVEAESPSTQATPLEAPASQAATPQAVPPSSGTGRRWGHRGAGANPETPAAPALALVTAPPIPRAVAASGLLLEKGGDLLQADEAYLVHQCNCVMATAAQGIAAAVFQAFPAADVYSERAARGRPHDVPGTISVHGRAVNAYGQLLPGRPAEEAPQGGWPGVERYVTLAQAAEDTRGKRFCWFESCLAALSRALPGDGPHSIAFPAQIGCGLAGGHWPKYLAALRRFAAAQPHWRVAVYDINGAPPQPPSASSSAGALAAGQQHGAQQPPLRERAGGLPAPRAQKHSGLWSSACLEALRGQEWVPLDAEEQDTLIEALRCRDACEEAVAEASRQAALAQVRRVSTGSGGAGPSGHSAASVHTDDSLAGTTASMGPALAVTLQRAGKVVTVSLAGLAAGAGFGSELRAASATAEAGGSTAAAPVRLRFPAVGEGKIRLPEELDEALAPAPRSCGRLVDGVEELRGLAASSGCCNICLEELHDEEQQRRQQRRKGAASVILLRCGHAFHEACLVRWFEERRQCPSCKRRFGHVVGNQPRWGSMTWRLESGVRLAGHDCFTICLNFHFPAGVDDLGQPYKARTQRAFLPHTEQGKLLLELLKLAFRRRVLFTLRASATAEMYWPAFNIHLKTATSGGPERFGFPDAGYFQRATEELRENGLTIADLA